MFSQYTLSYIHSNMAQAAAAAVPSIICFFTMLALSSSGMVGTHLLPPWFQASLLRLRTLADPPADDLLAEDGAMLSGPEGPLLQRLQKVNAEHDPEAAYNLHAAVANILWASGSQREKALLHFEAARDAAVRSSDPDMQLASHIKLSEAYIEEGRPLDSQRALVVAAGVLANHFTEHAAKLNRGLGRSKFELGFTESALGYFEHAETVAVQIDDKVRIVCDIALANACLGKGGKSMEPLRDALASLHASNKAGAEGGLPADTLNDLQADVHFRLAELFHSMQDAVAAKRHYSLASHLQSKSPRLNGERAAAIRRGIARVDQGKGPELRCPTLPRPPWEKVAPQNLQDADFLDKVNLLLAEQKYDLAESELKAGLRTHRTEGPYKSLDAATVLNMLGKLYHSQKSFSKSAKHFRQALMAVIACCGVEHQEAKVAYDGLRGVKEKLPYDEQRVVAAAISQYLEKLEKLGVSAGSQTEKEDIINLLTYSQPLVIS